MPEEWFLLRNGRREGPLSAAELRRRAMAGELAASDLVWRQGLAEPVTCGRVRGLLPVANTPNRETQSSLPSGSMMPEQRGVVASGTGGSSACPKCGRPSTVGDGFCTGCGAKLATAAISSEDMALGMLVPHKCTALSVIAGYVGIFSLCVIPAPVALLLGILALRDLKHKPGNLGYSRAIFAIVMGALGSLVAIILMVGFMISAGPVR